MRIRTMIGAMTACILAAGVCGDAARAQGATVQSIFEKYGLLGTFAIDCGRPAGNGNFYYVHRPLDGGYVQRDLMSSPTKRDWAVVIESAVELKPNEIAISGTREGQPVQSVYRAEKGRMRVLESSSAGKTEIVGGRFVGRSETPWATKCSAP